MSFVPPFPGVADILPGINPVLMWYKRLSTDMIDEGNADALLFPL